MPDERWLLTPIPPPTPAEIAHFADQLERDGKHLLWTGRVQDDLRVDGAPRGGGGYGKTQYRRKPFQAHRLAFAFTHGGLPPWPFIVAHRCDRKLCCAPNCLLNSTRSENGHDQWRLWEVGATLR